MVHKEAGHRFLARLGKKRLRPGGIEATHWLYKQANLSEGKKILEVACNMGTTAVEVAQTYHCSVVGVDLDRKALKKAEANIRKAGVEKYVSVQYANATNLPFADQSFDVVINEAMMTMLPKAAKLKAVQEYYRVLKPGGVLLTHDVSFQELQMEQLLEKLRETINVRVEPLSVENWEQLFRQAGFANVTTKYGAMTLLSPRGMIRDEGIFGAMKIIKNGLKKENRTMFRQMFHFFNQTGKNLKYIAVCSRK
ncbi:class I SAM-dependent methyltransferase [Sporolactobacillus nakayamae]|uniref:Methyltransferase domain-containing protein n=1 Tax=Sporolactobacillus nakayamae TaxID=269670 RepID=A0A1I2W6P0_9BACL|nr:class I SAM-dependent methyltransferase [Sporolactobacillus nakayamae]SFG95736.1 Methyltransferase domain-containing protein [Sporolactobacillus nakayamae]